MSSCNVSQEVIQPPIFPVSSEDRDIFISMTTAALQAPDADIHLIEAGQIQKLETHTLRLIKLAFESDDELARRAAHVFLKQCYDLHVQKPSSFLTANQDSLELLKVRKCAEKAWMAWERKRIPQISDQVSSENIGREIKNLWKSHPGHNHEIFDFLKTQASRDQIILYFMTDYALNMRFYDLIVLSLIGIEEEIRPEVACNFWDEVGRGDFTVTHVQLYQRLLNYLGIQDDPENFVSALGWEGLAGYNLLLHFALTRRDYFRSIGALAITELSDPSQYEKLLEGCRRAGIGNDKPEVLDYYREHIEVDAQHGDGWLDRVIVPLSRRHPDQVRPILEGAIMRLNSSKDYWDWQLKETKKCFQPRQTH